MTTITVPRAVVEQALEALRYFRDTAICSADTDTANEVIPNLEAALAAPVPHGCHVDLDLEEGMEPDVPHEQALEEQKPTALLDWSLYVDCPKCGLSNNLASCLHDAENNIARHIFNNEWDKLVCWEVACEGCKHEFLIGGVEY